MAAGANPSMDKPSSNPSVIVLYGAILAAPLLMSLLWVPGVWMISNPDANQKQFVKLIELGVIAYAFLRFGGVSSLIRVLPKWAWTIIALIAAIAFTRPVMFPDYAPLSTVRALFFSIDLFFGLSIVLVARSLEPMRVATIASNAFFTLALGHAVFWLIKIVIGGMPAGQYCHLLAPGVGNVRFAAYLIAPAIAVSCWRAAIAVSRKEAFLFVGIGALLAAFAVWTGTRSIFLGVGGALIISLILSREISSAVRVVAAAAAIVGAGVLLSAILPLPDCASFGLFDRSALEQSAITTNGRADLWRAGWQLAQDNLWFGRGDADFDILTGGIASEFHSVLIEFLVRWGLVGTALATGLMAYLFVKLTLAMRTLPRLYAAPLIGFSSLAAISLVDGTFNHYLPTALSAALLGFASALAFMRRPAP